jgi:nucleoid-associated protein YgaU
VTLRGRAADLATKTRAMEAFNQLVETDNTMNMIELDEKPTAPAPEPEPAPEPAAERIHEVVSGDTLGALSQKYYGKASEYMKIFEANRDQLDDPNLIKVGQKLRIPE